MNIHVQLKEINLAWEELQKILADRSGGRFSKDTFQTKREADALERFDNVVQEASRTIQHLTLCARSITLVKRQLAQPEEPASDPLIDPRQLDLEERLLRLQERYRQITDQPEIHKLDDGSESELREAV